MKITLHVGLRFRLDICKSSIPIKVSEASLTIASNFRDCATGGTEYVLLF